MLLSDARIGLIRVGADGYALVAGGTVRLIGVEGVTLGGTASVRVNTTGIAVNETLEVPGSTGTPVVVAFPSAARVTRFEVTGMTLSLMGQSIGGDLVVDKTADGDVVLAVANATLSLGGAVSLTHGAGVIVVGATGVAGSLSGTLALTVPGVTFLSDLAVAFNNTTAAVNRTVSIGGTTATLDAAGRTVLPARRHRRHPQDPRPGAAGGPRARAGARRRRHRVDAPRSLAGLLVLGSGRYGVTLTNGSGLLLVTATGVAGRLTGQLSLDLPADVSLTGQLSLAVNTTFAAVDTSITVGGTPVAIVAAGRAVPPLRGHRDVAVRPRSDDHRRLLA